MLEAKVFLGDCRDMSELDSNSVHLVVTSPPYYNAPFDYPGLFESYEAFLDLIRSAAREIARVLAPGRVAALVVDDTLIDGEKYPVVADVTRVFLETGFRYRERIIWVKPEGYIRISRRSGVLLQNPYPMYFYPDNIQESILIFQKGSFDYKSIPQEVRKSSIVDLEEYQREKWYLSVWTITNVLPIASRLEKGVAAFPEEIPYRLIKLFSHEGETVLDPFAGSGTTLKVALSLGRNAVGYEIDAELRSVIEAKLFRCQPQLSGEAARVTIVQRPDSKHLRTQLQSLVKKRQHAK
jgi:DNA modification methylase